MKSGVTETPRLQDDAAFIKEQETLTRLEASIAETKRELAALDEKTGDQSTVEQWLQIRKEAGLRIDAETAEVMWSYEYTLDPYGVYPDLSEEEQQTGRE